MSFLFYLLSLIFLPSSAEEDVITYTNFPRITEYDLRDLISQETTIKWYKKCRSIQIDHLDENLFDESNTPPITMYTGEIKSILKRTSTNNLDKIECSP